MLIVYIHGHGATGDSFNYIRSELRRDGNLAYQDMILPYDSANGFASNLESMRQALTGITARPFFIAHSLGGLYALHLAQYKEFDTLGAVTMATPYGGSEAALALNILSPQQQIYKDIHPRAKPILDARNVTLPYGCTWHVVTTTEGHSTLMRGENDGVVTMASMRAITGFGLDHLTVEKIASNHHEIVLNPDAVRCVQSALVAAAIRRYGASI